MGGRGDFEGLTPGGLPTGASLLSGRHVACSHLHPVTPDDLHTGVSLLGGRGEGDVSLRCLHLVVCPQVHHC